MTLRVDVGVFFYQPGVHLAGVYRYVCPHLSRAKLRHYVTMHYSHDTIEATGSLQAQ